MLRQCHYISLRNDDGQNGISHTRLDHISETGYIWTGRTSSTHTEEIPHAQVLDKTYDILKGNMDRAKWRNNNQLRLAQVLAEQAAKQRAAEMNKRFLEALRKALLGLDPDDPDVRAILENVYIKNLLSSLRNYDTLGAPLNPEVKALRQLDAEASSDLQWWEKFFNPTFDLDVQRFELSPLSSFLLEHPEFLLGPASLVRQAVKTAACVALQRVAPKLLAASGAALAWENFVSFMKGGKNAVKKTTAGEATPRLGTSGYKGGQKWTDLKPVNTPETTRQIGKINKQAFGGVEVRTDGEYVFRFDPAHKTAKVHMERYKKIRNNHWRADAEIDPNTGDVIAGSAEKLAQREYSRAIKW